MKSIRFKQGNEYVYPHCYFPVGYIYLSTVNTNPSKWFGGTWEQIKDRFLLTAGSSYTAGNTGGSSTININHNHTNSSTGSTTLTSSHIPQHNHTYAKAATNTGAHTLTISELPSHNHSISNGNSIVGGGSGDPAIIATSSNGSYVIYWANKFTIGNTGGGNAHTHPISTNSTNTGNWGTASPSGHTHTVSSTGYSGSSSQSIMPPYIVVYAWKRTK